MSDDDTRRAEAFALYNSFIARGWGDGDKAAFASRAEAAIEAAGVFNETWGNREGLQRDHDALRAELEAAKRELEKVGEQLTEAWLERDAANARIAELEAYKARVEALPVEYHVVRKTVHGTFETMNEYTVKRGRFIPAEEE